MKFLLLKFIQIFYKAIIKPIIFLLDPEDVHNGALTLGEFFGKYSFTRAFTRFFFKYENKLIEQNILGIKFKSPVGLAAGYDKYVQMPQIVGSLGFGFEEVGSISNEPSKGNPRPRLWRLKKSRGIIVWYGLNNNGAIAVQQKIKKLLSRRVDDTPIGVSIVKTNSPQICSLEESAPDVIEAFKKLADVGSYYTLNISCPNTGGEGLFYNTKNLEVLLRMIAELKITKPIFIKMPPDLDLKNVDEILEVSRKYGIKGFILSNIVKHRELMKVYDKRELAAVDPGKGSISGKPVEELSNKLIKHVYQKTQGEFLIIGCGGIFSAEDAYKKIRLGASLVQLITGMIFEGPQLISQINRGLVRLLERDGFKNISEAVGVDAKDEL